MTSRVTVGIPTLNSEAFLQQQLTAWTAQTEANFEIVIVDGGSTDGTLNIANRWCERDARIRIASQRVVGLYRSFNEILDLARTEWVTIQPADDLVSENFLQTLIRGLETFPQAAAAVSPLRVIDERSETIDSQFAAAATWTDPFPDTLRSGDANRETPAADIQLHPWPLDGLLGLAGQNPYVSQNQIVYRTRSIGDRRFDPTYGTTADILFNLQTGLRHDVVHAKGCWAGWRLHGNQASQSLGSQPSKLEDLRAMIREAVDTHSERVPDVSHRKSVEHVAEVMERIMNLRQSASQKTRVQRLASLVRTAIERPQAAWLYWNDRRSAEHRGAPDAASKRWLADRSLAITADRIRRGIEQS